MQKAMIFAAALAGAALASQAADATVLYSNFAPGNSYQGCCGMVVGGSTGGWHGLYIQAAEFRAPIYASLDQIDVALVTLGGADTALVGLWTKSAAGHPGYNLGSWVVTGLPAYGASNSPLTISGITGIILAGGEHYYVSVGPVSNSDDSKTGWNLNSSGALGNRQSNYGWGWSGNSFGTATAFDVVGTAVPEPGTIALVLGGLAGTARLRRRRAIRK
jgi:hypothetical protein